MDAALDLLFPRPCAQCGGEVAEGREVLCWECRADFRPVVFPFCSVCGNPIEGRMTGDYVCYLCKDDDRHFDCARSAARFEGVLQHMIHQFKYREALWVESELVDLLQQCFDAHYESLSVDGVVAVPLFHARRRERGYNQAEVLARGLARRLRKPFWGRALKRIRATETQTHLTAPQRADNVRGAFEVGARRRLAGRSVLLVDDVMTTGATLSECARSLKAGGARSVFVLTLARGTRM